MSIGHDLKSNLEQALARAEMAFEELDHELFGTRRSWELENPALNFPGGYSGRRVMKKRLDALRRHREKMVRRGDLGELERAAESIKAFADAIDGLDVGEGPDPRKSK